ncbi:hypothetical protein EMIHUDRAFT_460090 [Emiliania huxleyi CCMP1516]|uniref:Uncharacterized protein n=2 Tax=Emiliania huxleyi TaxID=2903 RepID=A0A0D3I5Y5_EMIH1|nr:hypothetical protein EMIHUDRAFT_460090 [Emiliania huxleyi CCMP1516]EOD06670.1 hypothetical protein EMIHUDRAFT_460090 [Emiliania huxleyi CCMP1516]|eukprot:XP_005759099.1 hypothetical protein EMIHUDRAFT_460090 [Emiliania huxleyi CCMP1516]
MTTDLSDYEKERLANIARNQKVLESLGLVRRDAELHESIRSKEAPKKKRKADPESADAVRAAVRRSARLAGAPASRQGLLSPSAGDSSTAGKSSSADHSEAQADYERWSGKQARATIVGTASYAHTLMRAIERACGQHAVAKMKLFATILALEGYVGLAEDASAAYERLRERLGAPCEVREGEEAES